jgi:cytochrome b
VAKRRRDQLRIWDLPTRLFHWGLAGLVAAGLATGFFAPEWWLEIHIAVGLAAAALVVFRLVWGICGSEHSRFASFAYGPRAALAHLRDIVRGRVGHWLGHNPAGAMMVFALLAVLAVLAASGVLAMSGVEKLGPFAGLVDFATGNGAARLHTLLAWLVLALVALHLAGVALESLLARENLVRAMIDGRKTVTPDKSVQPLCRARPVLALAVLAGVGIVLAGGLAAATRLGPPALRPLAWPAEYGAECGACHTAYHPSLLPAASWRTLMTGLDDHFGEDASLPDATAAAIGAWLAANAAETWDTEAANSFRRVAPGAPLSITATPFWTRRHAAIPAAVFAQPAVGGKVQCSACHRDADSGRFDDAAIAIPQG